MKKVFFIQFLIAEHFRKPERLFEYFAAVQINGLWCNLLLTKLPRTLSDYTWAFNLYSVCSILCTSFIFYQSEIASGVKILMNSCCNLFSLGVQTVCKLPSCPGWLARLERPRLTARLAVAERVRHSYCLTAATGH